MTRKPYEHGEGRASVPECDSQETFRRGLGCRIICCTGTLDHWITLTGCSLAGSLLIVGGSPGGHYVLGALCGERVSMPVPSLDPAACNNSASLSRKFIPAYDCTVDRCPRLSPLVAFGRLWS